jgi:hypothetical protein
MGWWDKVKHTASKIAHKASSAGQKLFQKGEVGGTKLFGKGSVGSQILAGASKGLDKMADVTGQVGTAVGSFASKAAPVLAAMGPLGEGIAAGAAGLSAGLGGISNTARLASGATKQKNYSGSAGNVAANILEKAKGVHDSASGISFV